MFAITGALECEPQLTPDQVFKINGYIDYYYDDYDGEWFQNNKFILFTERPNYKLDMNTLNLSEHIANLEDIIDGFLSGWSIKVVGKLSYSVTWNEITVKDFLTLEVSEGKVVVSDERYKQEISLLLVIHRYYQAKIASLEKENELLKLELTYQPGGPGAQKAKEHFDSLLTSCSEK